ncbi:unnamed protein product [Prorocentrum cordatum]|uniref:Uncharacterized protein n=1 Tax=Prorocentrum cordatum TaxID=2364126 RepID=A0ABN9TA42_9DINO|nr:unnamed protein product [Polarella glacialis]
MARDTGADAESSIAELPEQVDVVTPLRGEAEDRPAGFSRQQSTQQPGEVSITFDTLRFTIRQNQSGNPVVDASLLTNESLQQWVAGWSSCRAWMQDFVNAILRPVSSESWPPSAGPPASASFRVAFRGSCRLPPDILTRSGVPCSPPSLPLQGGGDAASAERRHSHSPDGDVVMTPAGSGPPVRLKVSRVSLSRRWDDRPNRPTRNHSRERVSPSPSARGHSSPLAVAPQRSPRRVSRRADPDWPGPAPAPIGAAQSWRECAESRGESGSFKDSCEGSERSVQI